MQFLFIVLAIFWGNGAVHTVSYYCGFPGAPSNGVTDPTKTFYSKDENVTFGCTSPSSAIQPYPHRTAQCLENGKWSNPVPICLDKKSTIQFDDFTLKYNNNTEEIKIGKENLIIPCNQSRVYNVSLPAKFHLVSISIHALQWHDTSNKSYSIRLNISSNKSEPKCSGMLHFQSTEINCRYDYIKDFIAVIDFSHETSSCNIEISKVSLTIRQYSQVCGQPSIPLYGSSVRNQKMGIAYYHCWDGYTKVENRTCKNGTWENEDPVCVPSHLHLPLWSMGPLLFGGLFIGIFITFGGIAYYLRKKKERERARQKNWQRNVVCRSSEENNTSANHYITDHQTNQISLQQNTERIPSPFSRNDSDLSEPVYGNLAVLEENTYQSFEDPIYANL